MKTTRQTGTAEVTEILPQGQGAHRVARHHGLLEP
jgi:hypothetical protein